MKATIESTGVAARSFPVLLLTSVGIPLVCAAVLAILIALDSDYAMPTAYFSLALSAIAVLLRIIGVAWGERPRWLLVASVAASAVVVYSVSFMEIR